MYLCGHDLIPTHNSTIITFGGIIQEVLIDADITVAIFSHTTDIARAFLSQIKNELEANDYLKELFSDVLYAAPRINSPRWSASDGIVVKRKSNPKEATVEAHGLVDAQPVSRHYALMVYDDVVIDKSVTSPEMIRKTTLAWENSDNLAKADSNRKWHAGTRWSYGDTYGIILERKILKPRVYPATDDGTLKGKPVFLTQKRWDEIKLAQKSTVSAQMLLNPVAGTDAMFLSQWFSTYEIVPAMLNVYIMADPSKGRSKDSDRTAIAVIGVDQGGNKYLLDGVRHRMRLSERYDWLKQFWLRWSVHPGVQMCKVGYEVYGAQADTEVIEEYQQRDKLYFEIQELSYPRQGPHSKTARVERLEPDMKSGRFYLPAVVWHPDAAGRSGICTWGVWNETRQREAEKAGKQVPYHVGQIIYRPLEGLTKQQRYCEATGQVGRILTAIKRRAEDGDVYDLTRAFIEEARFFPFAPHDDLIDVTSRIYDMDVIAPVPFEASAVMPLVEDDAGGTIHDFGGDGSYYDA